MLDLEVAFTEDPWERKTIRLLAARSFIDAVVQLKRREERALLITKNVLDLIPMLGAHAVPHDHIDIVVDDDNVAMDMFEMFDIVLEGGLQPKVIIENPFIYLEGHKQKKYHYIFWFPDEPPSDEHIKSQFGASMLHLPDVGVLFVSYPMERVDGPLQKEIDKTFEERENYPSLWAARRYSDGEVLDAFIKAFERHGERSAYVDERLRRAHNLLRKFDQGAPVSGEDVDYYRQYILEAADRFDQFASSPWASCLLTRYEGTLGRFSLLGRRAWSVGDEGKGFFGAVFQSNRALPGSNVKNFHHRFRRMRKTGGFSATHEEDSRKGFARLLSLSGVFGNEMTSRARALSCISSQQLDELEELNKNKEEETVWTSLSFTDSDQTSSKEPQLPRSKTLASTSLGSAIFESIASRKP